jgi:hypothetical protein
VYNYLQSSKSLLLCFGVVLGELYCHASGVSCCWLLPCYHAGLLVPPSAEQRPKQLTQDNDTRQDKYYW